MKLYIKTPIEFNESTQTLFYELVDLVSLKSDTKDIDREAAISSVISALYETGFDYSGPYNVEDDDTKGMFASPGKEVTDVATAITYAFENDNPIFTPGMNASCIIIRRPHDGKDWWIAHATRGEVRTFGDNANAVKIGDGAIKALRPETIDLLPSQEAAVSAEFDNRINAFCTDDFRFYPPFFVKDNEHLALIQADPKTNYPLYAVPFISVGLPYQSQSGEAYFVFDDPTKKNASIFRAAIKFDAEGNFIVGKGEQAAFYMCVESGGAKYVYPVHSESNSQGIVTVACPELCRMFSKANAQRNEFLGIGTEAGTGKAGVNR